MARGHCNEAARWRASHAASAQGRFESIRNVRCELLHVAPGCLGLMLNHGTRTGDSLLLSRLAPPRRQIYRCGSRLRCSHADRIPRSGFFCPRGGKGLPGEGGHLPRRSSRAGLAARRTKHGIAVTRCAVIPGSALRAAPGLLLARKRLDPTRCTARASPSARWANARETQAHSPFPLRSRCSRWLDSPTPNGRAEVGLPASAQPAIGAYLQS